MKWLNSYKKFELLHTPELHIFDLDGTLVYSPSFEELAIKWLSENVTIRDLIEKSINIINADINDLKWQDGRIYINDPHKKYIASKNWVRKNDRLYLITPNEFHTSEISLPAKKIQKIVDIYNSIEDKCIVTARSEQIRNEIINRIKELGMEMPKYGVHMAPENSRNLGTWKGNKIVEILKNTGFKSATFYDDNAKYIRKASEVVQAKMPEINWKTIKIEIN